MRHRMLSNYETTLSAGDAIISSKKAPFWTDWKSDLEAFISMHSKDFSRQVMGLSEGETLSIDIPNVRVAVECILNRPAPRAARRPPYVIAEEKKAKAEKARQRAIDIENRKKAEEKERACRRQRITNQIDHAFKSGPESGSEPVAKYISCQRCDAPAVFLELDREVARGAAVLDESTIIGAGCSEHDYTRYSGNEKILCSRLEFFYTGIRKIGIKEANS
jgi:hypothetical protein